MSPTVLSIAYPFALVSADPVGGAEQVLGHLDRAIVAQGWTSLVIAQAGSCTAGELIATPAPAGQIDDEARDQVHLSVRAAIDDTLRLRKVDLVHLHGVDFSAYMPPPGPPVLATLHLPIAWYPGEALQSARPLTFLQPVSTSQARDAPEGVALCDPIENGVDVDALAGVPVRKSGYALTLGRICPEKGFHLAIEAAKTADVELRLAGETFAYTAHQRYFEEEIAPRLDSRRRFIGPVHGDRKARLIAAARCVLIPSLASETSSLVAREAAAAGTPVIAFRRGALVDTVEHGRTGFLVDDVREMAEAIGRTGEIDPEVCRRVARERFPLARMTNTYLQLYRSLLDQAGRSRAA